MEKFKQEMQWEEAKNVVYPALFPNTKEDLHLLQIASLNGHLCHIWRPACDLNGGQPRTH